MRWNIVNKDVVYAHNWIEVLSDNPIMADDCDWCRIVTQVRMYRLKWIMLSNKDNVRIYHAINKARVRRQQLSR